MANALLPLSKMLVCSSLCYQPGAGRQDSVVQKITTNLALSSGTLARVAQTSSIRLPNGS